MASRNKKHQKKGALAHHRHTGKLLPRHHTSWPFVALLLLMLGVFLTLVTLQARAADVAVTATAEGPLPPGPAVILSPDNGDHFTQIPITVVGSCPAGYLVELFRNQVFSGSAQCQPGGTFNIETDLFMGENELDARIYNFADQEGPRSPPVAVTYGPAGTQEPPATPGQSPPEQNPGGGPKAGGPFFLTTDKFYKANQDKQQIDWTFGIVGGSKPFHITVDWGDGSTSELKDVSEDSFSVSHAYTKGTRTREYYPTQVQAVSADKRKATLQVFNILNYTNPLDAGTGASLPTGGTSFPGDSAADRLMEHLRYAWPAYAVVTLMAISFWLGQNVIIIPAAGHKWARKSGPLRLRPKH